MRNPFAVSSMIPAHFVQGGLPNTKQTYGGLWKLAAPSVAELVLTSLIGMVDTQMVSGLGDAAIAAVSLAVQPRMLVLSLFMALNVGVTATLARRKGEGRQDAAQHTLRSVLWIMVLASAVVTVIAEVFAEPLMIFAGANEETLQLSCTYYQIFISVTPIQVLLLVLSASQRGIGNTKVVMYVNVIGNLANVLLNWLLIHGNCGFPAMGVAGAALASAIGVCVSALGILISVLLPSSYLRLSFRKSWIPNKEIIRAVANVGGNAIIEQMAMRIGFFLSAIMIAHLGTQTVAAHNICMQMLNLTWTAAEGLSVAATSLVGQNLGRNRADLSMLYGKAAQRIAMVASVVLAAVTIIFRYQFISIFTTKSDPAVISMCATIMLWVAFFQPFQMGAVALMGSLRGAGDTRFVSAMTMITIGLVRPVVSALCIYSIGMGVYGAWMGMYVDMIARMFISWWRFSKGKWMSIKI